MLLHNCGVAFADTEKMSNFTFLTSIPATIVLILSISSTPCDASKVPIRADEEPITILLTNSQKVLERPIGQPATRSETAFSSWNEHKIAEQFNARAGKTSCDASQKRQIATNIRLPQPCGGAILRVKDLQKF
jgi:hypothetical protein